MIPGIPKKVIFSSFLFINLIQPSNSAALSKVYLNEDNEVNNPYALNISNGNPPFLANLSVRQNEIVVQSDSQSELNNILYAEGNVSVSLGEKLLKADSLIYDKTEKKISAKGNVVLLLGDQTFTLSEIQYSFISKKGYLLDVKGSINTNTLMDDLSSKLSSSESNKLKDFLELKKKEVVNTSNKVDNWLFFTDKLTIDGNKWTSKRAVFSNDLLELKQVKLAINSLEVTPEAEKLRFKSSLNYLIFEEKVSVPFWLGNRTITKSDKSFKLKNKWNIGYENFDKDGYFIGRKFDSIDISDDFVLDLEPQFLIQRLLKGHTNSFVKKDESITSDRVKRNSSFEDYFAIKSQIKGPIKNWNLEIDQNLNSFLFLNPNFLLCLLSGILEQNNLQNLNFS